MPHVCESTSDASVYVAGSGGGVNDQRKLDRVLRPFEQVESALARQHGGTGLGLPISRRLVEMHGGRLELDSRLGEGTTATVVLPPSRVLVRP